MYIIRSVAAGSRDARRLRESEAKGDETMTDTYHVCIRGATGADDGLTIDMPRAQDQPWYDVPLPDCPDCGGDLVWFEAGYVPGTRRCKSCGSMFSVQTDAGRVYLRRERLY